MTQITRKSAARLPVPALVRAGETAFALQPDADWLAELVETLDLLALRKLRFAGRILAAADGAVDLTASLGATFVQPCVVTLEPVTTRIDEAVARRYLPDLAAPEADEVEIPEDDRIEALGTHIDLAALLAEALALNLPLYPRAPGAEMAAGDTAAPAQETTRPFAGLAALRARDEPDGQSD